MRVCIAVVIMLVFANPSFGGAVQDRIAAEVDALLIEGDHTYEVIAVSGVVDGLVAVSLKPPYREFPNIILFRSGAGSSLKRVYEAFSVGIQDEPSGTLDLHTAGLALDFTFAHDAKGVLPEKKVREVIRSFEQERGTVVWYGTFLHGHFGQRTKERYYIDKSRYKGFALQLLGERYNEYPDQECMMYDTPELKEVAFSGKKGNYLLRARTGNGQVWTIAFAGVDGENRYVLGKRISVENRR